MKKIKIGKKSRLAFSLSIMAMVLLMVIVYPVVAAEFEAETTATQYQIQYGDGTFGNVEYNTTTNVFDDWASDFSHDVWFNHSVDNGVQFGAIFENLAIIEIDTDISASLTATYTCYEANFTLGTSGTPHTSWASGYTVVINVTPLIRYYMELPETDIMNGGQEMWYRSPIFWNDSVYDNTTIQSADAGDWNDNMTGSLVLYDWYLNIYDSEDHLVYATIRDGRSLSMMQNNRMYDKLNFPFRSNEKYRFEEYVKVKNEDPILSFECYFAEQQDIGGDGNVDAYIFPRTPQARKLLNLEYSWSMIFAYGIGQAGTENLLPHSTATPYNEYPAWVIVTQKIVPANSVANDVASVQITIPFRTTKPVTVQIRINTSSNGKGTWSAGKTMTDVTGTIRYTLDIADPDNGASNEYYLQIFIYNLSDGHYSSYYMYPVVNGSTNHLVNFGIYSTGMTWRCYPWECNHFAMHFEVKEYAAAQGDSDGSVNVYEVLMGLGMIIGGIIVAMFIPPLGAILVLVGTTLIGSILILGGSGILDFSFMEWLGSVSEGDGVWSAVVRALKWVADGVIWIIQNAFNALLWLVEHAIQVGEAIVYWGAIILHAVAEIIWFVAFLWVLMFWNLFLTVMKYIAKGDPEGAWKAFKRPIRPAVTKAKKVYRLVKKPVKALAGRGRGRRR